MPKGTQFVRTLSEKLEDYTVIFLLPIFFAYTGLRTQIGLIDNREMWLDCALIIFVACAGKFGGSTIAGRVCGLSWREAATVGTLMNTRGLMELVILNIGLQEGVITPAVFAMMVIMALVTTAMTTPVLHWIYPAARFAADESKAKADEARRAFSVLVSVALPQSGRVMAKLAATLIGSGTDAGRLVALHLRRPVDHEAYRSGLDEAIEPGQRMELSPLLAETTQRNTNVEALSFVTRDPADDICEVAQAKRVDLVLMGFHKPVFGKTILGGTVHRVLSQCETNVAVFVDRGFVEPKRVLVPYLGSRHDRLAIEMAERFGKNAKSAVTILHVVPPTRGRDVRTLQAKQEVDRVFTSSDPDQPMPVEFKVMEDDSPVAAVLRESSGFDLVIIGVAEEWGLESHLFGWRPERIARECPSSMLIVRRFLPPESTTNA
jgi:nucleotide-binding universal stress UspA family protein